MKNTYMKSESLGNYVTQKIILQKKCSKKKKIRYNERRVLNGSPGVFYYSSSLRLAPRGQMKHTFFYLIKSIFKNS